MEVAKTDLQKAVRYLEDSLNLMQPLSRTSTRIANRMRLTRLLIKKLNIKLNPGMPIPQNTKS